MSKYGIQKLLQITQYITDYVIQQSLDDVGSELNVMRKELHKLMGVIKTKDMEIENLGSELETTKKKVSHRYIWFIRLFFYQSITFVM